MTGTFSCILTSPSCIQPLDREAVTQRRAGVGDPADHIPRPRRCTVLRGCALRQPHGNRLPHAPVFGAEGMGSERWHAFEVANCGPSCWSVLENPRGKCPGPSPHGASSRCCRCLWSRALPWLPKALRLAWRWLRSPRPSPLYQGCYGTPAGRGWAGL